MCKIFIQNDCPNMKFYNMSSLYNYIRKKSLAQNSHRGSDTYK